MMSLERSRGAVETLIPKPGQNLETETNKSENRDLKISELCRYFSKNFPKYVIITSKLKIFRISGTVASCID